MVRPRTKRGKTLRPPRVVKSLVSCGLSPCRRPAKGAVAPHPTSIFDLPSPAVAPGKTPNPA
jgi:hypothetical protein